MTRKKIAIMPAANCCGGDLSKKWFIFFSYCDPANGKMKRFKIYEGLHKIKDVQKRTSAAEKLCAEYTQKLKNGWNPFLDDEKNIYEDQIQYNNVAKIYGKNRASNKTVRYYSSLFILQLQEKSKLDPATISTYTSKLRTFCLWLEKYGVDGNDISTINNNVILQFFNYIIEKRKLSGNSVSKYSQIIRATFDFARKNKAININPVFDVPECNRINDKTPRPISYFDIQAFKNIIIEEDPQLWLAISFEYYCFLRPGKELRLMKISDIDFSRGIIDVDRFRSKTNLDRFPTIPAVFLSDLRDVYQLQNYPKHYFVFGNKRQPGIKPLAKNMLRYRFRQFRERLNMPDNYKFYSWKHTGNGRARDAGISLNSLQDQNGHQSIKTTEIYFKNQIGQVSTEIRDNFPAI